jgi:hypothetical protein
MIFSRRDFARLAVSAAPLARAFGKTIDSKINGVQLGVQTYSFRDLSLDDAIQAMVADGLGGCELFSPHVEPGGAQEAVSFWEGPPKSKAELKAYEEKIVKWRMNVPLDYFKGIRKKFDDAGINIYAFNLSPQDESSDAEIDRGFLMAKALGVRLITSSTTLTTARRMAPLAEKHNTMVAMHGHSDLKDPINSPLRRALRKVSPCRSTFASIWTSAISPPLTSMRRTTSGRTTRRSCCCT